MTRLESVRQAVESILIESGLVETARCSTSTIFGQLKGFNRVYLEVIETNRCNGTEANVSVTIMVFQYKENKISSSDTLYQGKPIHSEWSDKKIRNAVGKALEAI